MKKLAANRKYVQPKTFGNSRDPGVALAYAVDSRSAIPSAAARRNALSEERCKANRRSLDPLIKRHLPLID
jgi:hypothetical protein